jgi:hypothetical protein
MDEYYLEIDKQQAIQLIVKRRNKKKVYHGSRFVSNSQKTKIK